MGTIQNSFNQLLAMGAGAIGMGKHLSQQSEANKMEAVRLAEQYDTQARGLQGEADALAKAQEGLNKEYETHMKAQSNFVKGTARAREAIGAQGTLTPDEANYRKELHEAYKNLIDKQESISTLRKGLEERVNLLRERKKITDKKLGVAGLDVELKEVPTIDKNSKMEEHFRVRDAVKAYKGGKK